MASSPLGMMLCHWTAGAEGSALASASDGQLLERFVTHREDAAFAGLLCRHGPMVLNVCRRALANEQDLEDVFQATFLLLARKAGSIRRRESVGSWLHGVAHRLAVQCRKQDTRRRAHERQAGLERVAAAPPEAWEELRVLLDEAIAELPEKYRAALVLCYLEDHTHEEAARRLGCRLTTLRSRVARGRERLRAALLRRGLTLSGAAFLAALATSAAQAALPPALRIRTLIAALQFANCGAASTLISASTAALVEGGLRAMSLVKVKMLLLLLLAVGLAFGGAGVLAHQILDAKKPSEPPQPGSERAATPSPENKPRPAVDRFGDPLPERVIARLGTVRFRMGGLVCACAWSPDGNILAAGSGSHSGDNSITLFDAATGKPIRKLLGQQSYITSLAFSPDGRTLASASQAAIVLWDTASGKLLRQFSASPGQMNRVLSLAFTLDGKGLFSAGEDARIRLWDSATGKVARLFTGHEKVVRCTVLSPDGRTLASAADKEIRLWETATGKMIRRLTGQKEPIRALAFSPDGKLLASGSDDRSISSIWLWETATGKVQRRFPEDPKDIQERRFHNLRTLAFSPDGKTLATGHGDYALHFWDVATGKRFRTMAGTGTISFRGFHDGGIQCLIFARDGKRLVIARDNQLALLDVRSGKENQLLPAHRGGLGRVFFSADGKRLFTGSDEMNGRIREWDTASGEMIREIPGMAGDTARASFSPDRKILASSVKAQTLALWDTATGREIREFPLPLKQFHTPGDIVFSPDGKFLAVEEGDGKAVWLYDPATGKQVCTVEGMTTSAYPMHLTFSPDGRILAAADRKAIFLAEVPSGRQLPPILPPKDRYAVAVALSPDGRTLAAPCTSLFEGGRMILFEVATGKERLSFWEPPGEIHNVAISPDGRLLAAAGSGNNIIYLWDAFTCKILAQLKGHQGNIASLAFSPDGRRL
ncbi:MAG TPA: sigma-70 family RNA polymerase sigma factor, partial [Gemmataceae bacterium]|nr:sigma-70 family RNA polymerase sigma factor [Gemmataceae bacterium]